MEGRVKHDVARLDVTVEYHVLVLMVDIVEPCGDIHDDVIAGFHPRRLGCDCELPRKRFWSSLLDRKSVV